MRAAVHRFNPDGSGHETLVSGTRNVIGLRWYPGTDTLWGAVQERDLLGDDLVPDYFTAFKPGAFYGWPYAYIGPNEDPRRKGEAPDLVKKTTVPDVLLGSHVAVLDALFYTGKMFPKEYDGGAFLARHGSWNRSHKIGYRITLVKVENNKAVSYRVFAEGWLHGEEASGRPVDVLVMPDGALLVSDDASGVIYRISYSAQ